MTPAEVAYKTGTASTMEVDELVSQELTQVYYIASRMKERLPPQVELEDLVSAGVVGLLEAARSFDGSKNVQFRTFAKFRIRGAILDSLREIDWGSRYMRRRAREIAETTAQLERKLGRQPMESEVAAAMGVDLDQLQRIVAQIDSLQISGQQVSVSNEYGETFDVIESAPDLKEPDPFDLFLEAERKAHLAEAISRLSEREQLLLSLYYREELTLKEVSQVLGVSLSRVAQIREAAVAKLRTFLEHLHTCPPPSLDGRGEWLEHA